MYGMKSQLYETSVVRTVHSTKRPRYKTSIIRIIKGMNSPPIVRIVQTPFANSLEY